MKLLPHPGDGIKRVKSNIPVRYTDMDLQVIVWLLYYLLVPTVLLTGMPNKHP